MLLKKALLAMEERLKELRTLPRYQDSPLRPLIDALAEGIGEWKPSTFAPCLGELAKAAEA